jgi:muramidase (phage lysozyme)
MKHSNLIIVDAFLTAIRWAEGTLKPDGYRILFGHTDKQPALFNDFSKHPNIRTQFKQTDGKYNYSTAAGAYQIINPTWNGLCSRYKSLGDFSPKYQDMAAILLLDECGALEKLYQGKIREAEQHASVVWASLPSAKYPQPKVAQFSFFGIIASKLRGNIA